MGLLNRFRKRIAWYNFISRNRSSLARNREIKDSKIGQRCFIIANGPSLKQQDLKLLADEETFVVNTFWEHPDYRAVKPKNYVIIDADVFPSPGQPTNFWIEELIRNAPLLGSNDTRIFLNLTGKWIVEKEKLFKDDFLNFIAINRFFREDLNFNTDISKPIPVVKNVVIASLIIAVYMGFKEIYLLGCDHNFLAQSEPLKNGHFYDRKEIDLSSEAERKYYAARSDIGAYEQRIYQTGVLFRNYRLLKDKFAKEKPHVKIYNSTPGTFLDVFPYVNFEEVLKKHA